MPYLMKNRHGTFYLRIVLNKEQQASFKRREIRRSLGTTSKREANRRLPEAYVEAMRGIGDSTNPPDRKLRGRMDLIDQGPSPQQPMLDKVFEGYLNDLKLMGYRGRTIEGKIPVVDLLYKIVGNKPVDAYNRDDVRKLQDKLLKLPPRFQKHLAKGLSLQQVINLNKDGKSISTTTFNNYMAMYIAVFNYAIKEGYIENNPFRKTRIHQKKLKSSYRDVFDEQELSKIFSYMEGNLDIGDRNYSDFSKREIRADRYWLTYLSYYTAARIGEVAQLFTHDIYEMDGVWCIHIRAGNEKQSIKNLNSERVLPIHSDLIKLGFIEYVNKQSGHIFPMIQYSPKHGYGHQYSSWFRKQLAKMGINENKRLSVHSFRHTVANTLKQKGIEGHLISGLLGHSTGSITLDRYGKTLNPKSLVSTVEAIPSIVT